MEVLLYKRHGEVGVARVSAKFSMGVPLVFVMSKSVPLCGVKMELTS